MKRKFTRIGNSWAILFTKTMLEIMDINPEQDEVSIEFDRNKISMEKAENTEKDKNI